MFKTRLLTALVLFPLMFAALFVFSQFGWILFSSVMIILAFAECLRLFGFGTILNVFVSLITFTFFGAAYAFDWQMQNYHHIAVIWMWLVIAPIWLYYRWEVKSKFWGILLAWAMIVPAWFALRDLHPNNELKSVLPLLCLMGLVWVADIFAYFSGKRFGKNKLAPSISPGKTIEGVIGALIAVTIYVMLVEHLGYLGWQLTTATSLGLAILLTVVSVMGDLIESWFKRCSGYKDSSQLLPGHGGVYDRIDSLIAVLALANALRVLSQ